MDKILSNYFGNTLMLRRYQKKKKKKIKSHDKKDLLSSKFSNKCKKGFLRNIRRTWKILEGQPRPFFPFTPITSGLLCLKYHVECYWFIHFKYFENYKSYVNEFLHCQCNCYLGILSILLVPLDVCQWKGYFKKWTALCNQIPSRLQPRT